MARKLIHVTQEDIEHGVKGECAACPVARAVDRETGKWSYVGGSCITVYETLNEALRPKPLFRTDAEFKLHGKKRYDTPRSATRFINRFDTGEPVKPFNFYLKDR